MMSLSPPELDNLYFVIVHDSVNILDVTGSLKAKGFAKLKKTELMNFVCPVWLRTILCFKPKMIQVCEGRAFKVMAEFSFEA